MRDVDAFLDLPPSDPAWGHGICSDRQGNRVHYVRCGGGSAVVLLHGWPGLWYDYRRIIPTLGAEADAVAPDLRGFGASDSPALAPETGYGRQAQAEVVLDLLDALDLDGVVLVGYDVGSAVAQAVARAAPARVRGLVLGAPLHPGSGARALRPEHAHEFWYQDFHRLPLAVELAGRDRASVEAYLAHFYRHWTGNHESVRGPEFDAVVDVYAAPGALDASLNWYRSGAGTLETARRAAAAPGTAPPPLPHRAEVLWGERDALFPPDWADGLESTLSDHRLRVLPGVGHFIPFEAPQAVMEAIRALL
jgi:pimeloyl-ACP methyl ester carboxylesterase